MQQPKVSIVIPVYNGAKYLKEAIVSALSQTYRNTEALVVNDGSDDGGKTEKIAKSYGKKIRYLFKENGGVASALNLGIKKMTGEWFSWLSHDDVYFADKIAKQIEFVEKHPNARCIYSQHIYINARGKQIMRGVYSWEPNTKVPQVRQLLASNHINGCTTLIHRRCFNKAGLFDTANKTAQDYQMWLLLAAYFGFYYCPELVLKSRIHPKMGSALLVKEAHKYTNLAIRNADNKLSIYEIFADKLSPNTSLNLIQKCHIQLGDLYTKQQGLSDLARKHYLAGGIRYFNLRLFLGQLIYSFRQLYKSTYNALAWQILRWLRKA